jgi:hypothetical protein
MTTLEQLQAQIDQLKAENKALMHDSAFGILTRPGLEIEHRKLTGDLYAVFIDLNGIHDLNTKLGSYEAVDALVRKAFSMRRDDMVLAIAGKWKSGDEICFIVRADPAGFIARLQSDLAANGLSAMAAYARIENNDLIAAVKVAAKQVAVEKKARGITGR